MYSQRYSRISCFHTDADTAAANLCAAAPVNEIPKELLPFLQVFKREYTDVLCKIFKRLKSSKAIFLTDVTIVLLGVFLKQNLVISLLGVLSAMIIAFVIDKIFLGGSAAAVRDCGH